MKQNVDASTLPQRYCFPLGEDVPRFSMREQRNPEAKQSVTSTAMPGRPPNQCNPSPSLSGWVKEEKLWSRPRRKSTFWSRWRFEGDACTRDSDASSGGWGKVGWEAMLSVSRGGAEKHGTETTAANVSEAFFSFTEHCPPSRALLGWKSGIIRAFL